MKKLFIYEYPYVWQQLRDEVYFKRIAQLSEDAAFDNWPCGLIYKPDDEDCVCCHWDRLCNG